VDYFKNGSSVFGKVVYTAVYLFDYSLVSAEVEQTLKLFFVFVVVSLCVRSFYEVVIVYINEISYVGCAEF
jgi:hypothetical protein